MKKFFLCFVFICGIFINIRKVKGNELTTIDPIIVSVNQNFNYTIDGYSIINNTVNNAISGTYSITYKNNFTNEILIRKVIVINDLLNKDYYEEEKNIPYVSNIVDYADMNNLYAFLLYKNNQYYLHINNKDVLIPSNNSCEICNIFFNDIVSLYIIGKEYNTDYCLDIITLYIYHISTNSFSINYLYNSDDFSIEKVVFTDNEILVVIDETSLSLITIKDDLSYVKSNYKNNLNDYVLKGCTYDITLDEFDISRDNIYYGTNSYICVDNVNKIISKVSFNVIEIEEDKIYSNKKLISIKNEECLNNALFGSLYTTLWFETDLYEFYVRANLQIPLITNYKKSNVEKGFNLTSNSTMIINDELYEYEYLFNQIGTYNIKFISLDGEMIKKIINVNDHKMYNTYNNSLVDITVDKKELENSLIYQSNPTEVIIDTSYSIDEIWYLIFPIIMITSTIYFMNKKRA